MSDYVFPLKRSEYPPHNIDLNFVEFEMIEIATGLAWRCRTTRQRLEERAKESEDLLETFERTREEIEGICNELFASRILESDGSLLVTNSM